MIFLFMKIMLNGQMLHQSNIFTGILTMQILQVLSWSKYSPNLWLNKIQYDVYFFKYENLKCFIQKDDDI